MNPEQWLSLKWNGGSTMSDRWLNQSKIIQALKAGKKKTVKITVMATDGSGKKATISVKIK